MQVQNNTCWPWKTIRELLMFCVLCLCCSRISSSVINNKFSLLEYKKPPHRLQGWRDFKVFCGPYQEWEGFSFRGSALRPESNGQDEIWPSADWLTINLWIISDNSDSHALCNMSNLIAVLAATAYMRVTRLLNSAAAMFSFYHRRQHEMEFTDRKNMYL